VDAISLLSPLTGIGRYTYEISKNLPQENLNFFYGYHSKHLIGSNNNQNKMKRLKSFVSSNWILKRLARRIINISSKIFIPSYDLYWQPNFIPNINIKAKKIVTTVHDFSFILHKEYHPKERIEYFEEYFFKNIVKSDFIITGSHFSKDEILDRLDFDKNKIKVIYHGLNHELFKVKKQNNIDIELPNKYIFSVGSIEPRKNLIGLLKAYISLPENIKKEYKLLLAGFKGWENKEIMNIIDTNKNNIKYLGFVSDDELSTIYNNASLFVFPSFYEGFGLPILEAMACGTPVVSSNTSSMPEVGGDVAIYCDPNDVNDIKDKIKLVLDDTNLQKRMIMEGLERVKEFTWEKSAKEHEKIFQQVMKN
jgi:glycosyltransferase involved in cell wall biosynthesis